MTEIDDLERTLLNDERDRSAAHDRRAHNKFPKSKPVQSIKTRQAKSASLRRTNGHGPKVTLANVRI